MYKQKVIIILIFILILCLMGGVSNMSVYSEEKVSLYVDSNGDNNNSGSKENPLKNIEGARDVIREIKEEKGLPEDGIVVYLREGEYNLTKTLSFTSIDSGTEKAKINYKSYENEEVIFTGGVSLKSSAFSSVEDENILQRLSEEAKNRVVKIDLKEQGITDLGLRHARGMGKQGGSSVPELFFNKEPMTLSRWPNEGFTTIEEVVDQGSVPREEGSSTEGGLFKIKEDIPERWSEAKDIWLFGYWRYDWADGTLKVDHLDQENNMIKTVQPSHYGFASGQRFYVFNLLEEIDTPGEYYIDRVSGILYFYPPSDLENTKIQFSLTKLPLISLDEVSHVSFSGITMEATRGHGIEINNSSSIKISNSIFRNIGQKAIIVDGGNENKVHRNHIYNTGTGGIVLNGGNRQNLKPGDHSVFNNHIHNYSRIDRTYTPAVEISGVGNKVKNNLIQDAPHFALSFSGNDHQIEYNEIYDVCQETIDSGAIYSGRNWTFRGNKIRYNLFHNIKGPGWGIGVMGIYLDDMMSSTEIKGNIFYEVDRAILIGGGRDHIVENNIIIDNNNSIRIDNRAMNWASYHAEPGGANYERLKYVPYQKSPWKERYPELVNILEDDPKIPKNNTIINNVIYRTSSPELNVNVEKHGTINNNLETNDNPGFENIEQKDFSIKDDSIIYDHVPDFQEITLKQIGLVKNDYREDLLSAEINLKSPEHNAVNINPRNVKLSWEKSPGVRKYLVYIYEADNREKPILKEIVTDNNLMVDNLKFNRKYYWQVVAVSETISFAGQKTDTDKKFSFSTQKAQSEPVTPENLQALPQLEKVNLKWSSQKYANQYIIYRSKQRGNDFKQIAGDVVNNYYIDEKVQPGETYFYKIQAVNDLGQSEFTEIVEIKTKEMKTIVAEDFSDQINEDWNLEGSWAIKEINSKQVLNYAYDSSGFGASFGELDLNTELSRDFVLKVRLRVDEIADDVKKSVFHIYINKKGKQYYDLFYKATKELEFSKRIEEKNVLYDEAKNLGIGKWIDLEIISAGNELKLYVNEELIMEAKNERPLKSGDLSFQVINMGLSLDYIDIAGIEN